MSKYHNPEDERDLIAHYVESGKGPEERLPREYFSDTVTLGIYSAVEAIEKVGGTVSRETILSRTTEDDSLADGYAEYSEVLTRNFMPSEIAETLEGEIRDRRAKRDLGAIVQTVTTGLETGKDVSDIALSAQAGIDGVLTVASVKWPDPSPIVDDSVCELPFPTGNLPPLIRGAVEEVADYVKAPVSLVAYSALSYVNLATQHLARVSRDDRLISPLVNYYISIADSGERKTACDNLFGGPIREWVQSRCDAMKPEIEEWNAAYAIWETKRAGMQDALKQCAKKGEPTGELESDLKSIQQDRPTHPRVPRLFLENETPQSLRKKLSAETDGAWLSCALMSDEAGTILGGHAMQGDTKLEMLTTWNRQWDGKGTQTGRVGDGDSNTDGSLMSVGISGQHSVVRKFIADGEAAGCGALARFWLCVPESRKGFRPYSPPPPMPKLDAFGERLKELLSVGMNRDDQGRPAPPVISFSDDAKRIWVSFYDETEKRQAKGEDLSSPELSAVASKAGDIVARQAAMFHLFEGGSLPEGISKTAMQRAVEMGMFNLAEWKRFLGNQATEQEESDALALEEFLIKRRKKRGERIVDERTVQQSGPSPLRKDRPRRLRAFALLKDLKRARIEGSRIELNPKVLQD